MGLFGQGLLAIWEKGVDGEGLLDGGGTFYEGSAKRGGIAWKAARPTGRGWPMTGPAAYQRAVLRA